MVTSLSSSTPTSSFDRIYNRLISLSKEDYKWTRLIKYTAIAEKEGNDIFNYQFDNGITSPEFGFATRNFKILPKISFYYPYDEGRFYLFTCISSTIFDTSSLYYFLALQAHNTGRIEIMNTYSEFQPELMRLNEIITDDIDKINSFIDSFLDDKNE